MLAEEKGREACQNDVFVPHHLSMLLCKSNFLPSQLTSLASFCSMCHFPFSSNF